MGWEGDNARGSRSHEGGFAKNYHTSIYMHTPTHTTHIHINIHTHTRTRTRTRTHTLTALVEDWMVALSRNNAPEPEPDICAQVCVCVYVARCVNVYMGAYMRTSKVCILQ